MYVVMFYMHRCFCVYKTSENVASLLMLLAYVLECSVHIWVYGRFAPLTFRPLDVSPLHWTFRPFIIIIIKLIGRPLQGLSGAVQ